MASETLNQTQQQENEKEVWTMADLVQCNKQNLARGREQFQQIFGLSLGKFMHPLFGFDIVAFDEWLGTPDGISLRDHLLSTKGQDAVSLIESLI